MNCKQGDIARVVIATKNPANLGRIVCCTELVSTPEGPGWLTDPPLLNCRGALDIALRPIRDPGDDAVGETLVPGYVRDEVTA